MKSIRQKCISVRDGLPPSNWAKAGQGQRLLNELLNPLESTSGISLTFHLPEYSLGKHCKGSATIFSARNGLAVRDIHNIMHSYIIKCEIQNHFL